MKFVSLLVHGVLSLGTIVGAVLIMLLKPEAHGAITLGWISAAIFLGLLLYRVNRYLGG
jgi:hypothetical protein